jgi:DNA-damage-inducible protein J
MTERARHRRYAKKQVFDWKKQKPNQIYNNNMLNVFTTGIFSDTIQVSTIVRRFFMPNTSMNIRMDSEVKRQAQELFAQFGLDLTTAVNMFLRQSIRQRGIPFTLQLDPFHSETNQERLLQAAKRMERTGGTVHDLIEMEDD